LYRGDVARMIFRPIAGSIYLVAAVALLAPVVLGFLRKKPQAPIGQV
jgi:hypothetical protein